MGELTCITIPSNISDRRALPGGWGRPSDLHLAFRGLRSQHHFQICGCRLQFELQVRHPGSEKVKGNQSEDGNAKTAGRGDERLGDTAGDRLHSQLFVAEKTERLNKTGNRTQKTEQRRQSYECV